MSTFIPNIEDTTLKRKDGSGIWEIRWTEPAAFSGQGRPITRRLSCRTTDRQAAERFRREWIEASARLTAQTTSRLLGDLLDLYLEDHCEPNGVRSSQWDAIKPVKRLLGHLDIGDLAPSHSRDYRRHRLAEVVKDGTIRRELGALRAALSWAHKNEHWPSNLNIPHIALPSDSKPKKTYVPATKEADVFAQASADFFAAETVDRERIALFTCMALDTAARAEAIETLTLDRIHLVQDFIDYVDPTRRVVRKRRSVVPISDRLRPVVTEAVKRARKRGWSVLLGHTGSTEKLWRSYRKRLGIPSITRHDLRRTFATLAMQAGAEIWDVAGVLADTIQTTERNYAHHSPHYLRGAVNKRSAQPPEKLN